MPIPTWCAEKDILVLKSSDCPPLVSVEKANQLPLNTTLGNIVDALGPGWIIPTDSVGFVIWRLSDSRVLAVLPTSEEREAPVTLIFEEHLKKILKLTCSK